MIKRLISVGSFTLLSRITGFVRDMLMAWILGKGILSDAFIVAFLFPNYFRAIFGEMTEAIPRNAVLHARDGIQRGPFLLRSLGARDRLVTPHDRITIVGPDARDEIIDVD